MYSDTFWSTIEVRAWSQDRDYLNYLILHKQSNAKGRALSEDAYEAFCVIMENELEDDAND